MYNLCNVISPLYAIFKDLRSQVLLLHEYQLTLEEKKAKGYDQKCSKGCIFLTTILGLAVLNFFLMVTIIDRNP